MKDETAPILVGESNPASIPGRNPCGFPEAGIVVLMDTDIAKPLTAWEREVLHRYLLADDIPYSSRHYSSGAMMKILEDIPVKAEMGYEGVAHCSDPSDDPKVKGLKRTYQLCLVRKDRQGAKRALNQLKELGFY